MKSKFITHGIYDALKRWYTEERLTQEQIAQIVGVNRSSVNGWLSGEAKRIRAVNWVRLLPRLRQYLPEDALDADDLEINPESQRLLEAFRRRLQDAIMSSELDAVSKVKIFALIRDMPIPLKAKWSDTILIQNRLKMEQDSAR